MKLHLPKLLLTAVLAACVIPQSAEAVVFSDRSIESYTGSFSTATDYDSDGIIYDAETGALTGVDNSLFSFTLDMDAMTADNANGHVAYVTTNADKWGFNLDSNGTGLTGYWGKWESETSSGNWATSGTAAPADKLNALEKDINNDIVLTANISNSGTFAYAANGTPIFSMPSLQAGAGATITSFIVNNKYISSILTGVEYGHAVTNNDGTFNSSYASVSYDAIPSNQVEATFIGTREIQVNGASQPDNLNNIGNAGDIYVGQKGCLFLQTWAKNSDNNAFENNIEISNNIFIGSTSNGRGALATADYSGDVIIKGAVTLIEDSTYVKESAPATDRGTDTRFEGKLSGDYTLTVRGTVDAWGNGTGHFDDVEFAGEIDLKGLTTVAPIETGKADFTISGKTAIDTLTINADTKITKSGDKSMEFGDVVLNKKLELADSGTINITGTVSGTNKLEKTGSGTLELSGDNSYSGGTTITGGLVKATHANALGTGSVTVNGGKLEISGQHAIEGSELNITNGTVTATYETSSNTRVIASGTAININTGGTLNLEGHDMLGWYSAPSITLQSNDTKAKATLDIKDNGSNTFSAGITMNGNAQITGNKINTFGTSFTVTNKGNEVSVETIEIRNAWTIDVAAGGELALASKLEIHQDNEGEEKTVNNITKSNTGKLIITGKSSEWSGAMNVTGGTLQLQDDATLGLATVVMNSDTTLETGTGTIAALTLNAGSKLVADTAVSMDGALTLGGTITLNGGLLTALQSLEAGKTLNLFTNVSKLTLGEDTYTKGTDILDATTAKDLSYWFTLTSPETPALLSETLPAADSGYYLGYNAEGAVYVGKVIPEPTTATLSLLALAGLAARRRRK